GCPLTPRPPPPPPPRGHFPSPVTCLRQQALRKIYSLRQFRHFPPQLVHRIHEVGLPRSDARGFTPRFERRGMRPGERPHDQPREESSEQDDGDQGEHCVRIHQLLAGPIRWSSRFLASRRSAKSIRSLSSPSSRRTLSSSAWSASRCSASSACLLAA